MPPARDRDEHCYALARFEKGATQVSYGDASWHTADALSAIARYVAGFPGRKVHLVFGIVSANLSLSINQI